MSIEGVSVAVNQDALEENPTWTRVDGHDGDYHAVASWSIDRGRQSDVDKTGTGTATVNIVDTTGDFDPTNATGPFFQVFGPSSQAAIALWNPVDEEWQTVFRGHVAERSGEWDVSKKFQTVSLELVDLFAFLAATEMMVTSPPTWGDVAVSEPGFDIYFPEDTALTACQTRLTSVATSAGLPASWYSFNTGNVGLMRTVYARHDQALSVMLDVADAEFPTVANLFCLRTGPVRFYGRYPRFNPADVQYNITTWECGDAAAAAGDTDIVPIAGLRYAETNDDVINSVLSAPQGANLTEADIADQLVEDAVSIGKYGRRSVTFENLLTLNGEGPTTAMEETKLFAEFLVGAKPDPLPRVTGIDIRTVSTSHPNALKTWRLLTRIELNDIVTLTTTHPGGGGFAAEDYFVEGIHYQASPMRGDIHDITLSLDVSPRSWYSSSPFAGPS